MKKTSVFLLLLAGLLLGCTAEPLSSDLTPPDSSAESRGKNFVPLKGHIEWTYSSVPMPTGRCASDGLATLLFEGTGIVSHLGKVSMSGSQCVDPFGAVISPLLIVDGRQILTAANGDEVHLSGAGGIVPTANPLIFNVDFDFTITGGTGRFKNAEGWGHIGGNVEFSHFPPLPGDPTPKVVNVIDGMIAY